MLNRFMPNGSKQDSEAKEELASRPPSQTHGAEHADTDIDNSTLANALIRYLPLAERVVGIGERYINGRAQGQQRAAAGNIPTQTGYRVDRDGVKPIVQEATVPIQQIPITQEKVESIIEKYIDRLPENMTLGDIAKHYKSNKELIVPLIMKELND